MASLGDIRRFCGRLRRDGGGQALTEFAIVAPLIVMVLLFALWFYELVHVKLKLQESARYAAWEATAYPLHDYKEGPSALSKLSNQMRTTVMADTALRYADLDSSTLIPRRTGILAANWTLQAPIMFDYPEEPVPGGAMVNFIFSIAASIIDFFSMLNYKNINPVALNLIGATKANKWGGARKSRLFGDSSWGFNTQGFIEARVFIMVDSPFANMAIPGAGERNQLPWSMPANMSYLLLQEQHAVLADSWRLNNGEDVVGSEERPGNDNKNKNTAYWKQVDRMYLQNKKVRGFGEKWIKLYKQFATAALKIASVSATPPNLGDGDWVTPSVVSKNYKDTQGSGQVKIVQDRPTDSASYDTAPVGGTTGVASKYTDSLKAYGETLAERGEYFMGCKRYMQRGCPSATLQQDNPLGDYVVRDDTGGASK